MHRTASFHPSHSHEARRTQQPPPQPPIGLQRPRLPLPVHAIGTLPLTPKRHLLSRLLGTARQTVKRNTRNSKTGRSEPKSRKKKDVQQDGTGQRIERRKQDDKMGRAKRLNEGNRTTGWGKQRSRTKRDVRQDGAAQRIERKTTDVGRKHEWQALLRLPLEYHTMQVRS